MVCITRRYKTIDYTSSMSSLHMTISLATLTKITITRDIPTNTQAIKHCRDLILQKKFLPCQGSQFKMFSATSCFQAEDRGSEVSKNELKAREDYSHLSNREFTSPSQLDSPYDYTTCIRDLNLLQSNSQTLALAKYKRPEEILPLFTKQLQLAGIEVSDLDRLNIIHVSGTKGKGSTCAYVESILRFSGRKTGFYNSPHLVKVTERIRINGRPICDQKFSKYFRHIYSRLKEGTTRADITMPSYFSFLTILAFHIFLEEKVSATVLEVGIGGEFDPTNIIQNPVACGITTLDIDHTNILGNSIESIAWSKAGILKEGVSVFVVDEQPEAALEVIKSRSKEKKCPLFVCKPLDELSGIQLGIQGSVQFLNAALACQLSRYMLSNAPESKIQQSAEPVQVVTDLFSLPAFFSQALSNCAWPGRCEIKRYSSITFFMDGAHTKKSMKNCLDWFLAYFAKEESTNSRKILFINIIGDRDKSEILSQLCSYDGFEIVIFSSNRINSSGDTPKSETFLNIQGPNCDKSMENVHRNASIWNNLCRQYGNHTTNTIIMSNTSDSIDLICRKAKSNPELRYHVLVTGSLHFVGAVSETLLLKDEMLR